MLKLPIRCLPVLIFAAILTSPTVCRADTKIPLPNGDFENGISEWTPSPEDSNGKLSQAAPDAAHTGKGGLVVKQDATGPGSWLQSPKIPVEATKSYELHFWARNLETSGIGVFINFFDADHKNIPTPKPVLLQIPVNPSDWTEYTMAIKLPTGTDTITVSIHAFSKQACNTDFDDFTLVPVAP